MVRDLIAGRTPDPALGEAAKQRSIHNNYLTLPVVFTMLSNHYAFTYTGRWSWLVLAAVFIASFLVRHWFNIKHTGAKPDWRLWPAAAVPMLLAAGLTLLGQPRLGAATGTVTFADVQAHRDGEMRHLPSGAPELHGHHRAAEGRAAGHAGAHRSRWRRRSISRRWRRGRCRSPT